MTAKKSSGRKKNAEDTLQIKLKKIEKELKEKRHYSSTNRWVPTKEIKNGYVISSRHISLVSDASALEYIVF